MTSRTHQSRQVTHHYFDPLSALWLAAVERLGLKVERSSEVYASFDGQGTLTIGTQETLDADDCLAQMLLHELCHALVQSVLCDENTSTPDWGLSNADDRDAQHEHACLRLQAALLDMYGLRRVLAPTTDFRAYYDALGPDPLERDASASAGPTHEASVALAKDALERATSGPWSSVLHKTLQNTAKILEIANKASARDTSAGTAPIWAQLERVGPPQ